VLDNLEKIGLVERVVNPKDRRAITVRLSSKGKRLFEKIFPKHAEFVTSVASVLSEEEQVQLANLLKKLGLGIQDKLK